MRFITKKRKNPKVHVVSFVASSAPESALKYLSICGVVFKHSGGNDYFIVSKDLNVAPYSMGSNFCKKCFKGRR